MEYYSEGEKKKEWNADAYISLEESQKPWTKLKKSDTKKLCNACFNSYEILEITKPWGQESNQ